MKQGEGGLFPHRRRAMEFCSAKPQNKKYAAHIFCSSGPPPDESAIARRMASLR
jgi:hypothetical protein